MQVKIISATPYPASLISTAAGVCFDRDNISLKRVQTCFNANHLSVFEHASASFKVEGVSRATMAQITRHRHASFAVKSQRYCRYDTAEPDWFVTPEAFEQPGFVGDLTLESWYQTEMERCGKAYQTALDHGIKPEDARFLLPEAAMTNFVLTMNCRALFHLFDMRIDKAAQWEVHECVQAMHDALHDRGGEWETLIDMYDRGRNE